MNNIFKLFIYFFISYFGISSLHYASDQSLNKIKKFVQKVSLGVEQGGSDNVVSRWTTPPTLSVYDSTPDQKAIVNEVLFTINSCLKPLIGEAVLLSDNNPEASFKIIFAPQRDFRKIAREYNFKCKSNSWGSYWMFWDSKNHITSSIVLLATDKLSGDTLKRFAFEQIIQAFGLANDSDEFVESIFYEKGNDKGNTITPSELDLQLLRFFYQHLEPGDKRQNLNKKFEMFWLKAEIL